MNASPSARLRLRISPAAESRIRAGHPWVFSDSIRKQNREGVAGELAAIFDRQDRFLAVGFYDPHSPIRVRIVHAGKPRSIDHDWWATRLAQASERRRTLFNEQTTGYRVINGESDGWPGLVLDRYDSTYVLKIYSEVWVQRLAEITQLLRDHLNPERLVLRWSRNLKGSQLAALQSASTGDAAILHGPALNGPVVFQESGVRFEADVLRGQKTGFFLDQRENRQRVESLSRGRSVLNAFSFSGGFSLYAARGGAHSVTDLDISAHALASARRNFQLNASDEAVARCRHESIQGDTFNWLQENRRSFDLIILDPPSFAKRETERATAIASYERLSTLGLARLRSGGILVACSCSAHVTPDEFRQAVRAAARKSGRRFEELASTGHASDHPATFPEAEYLKALFLRMS